jgi:hypothetical protein
MNRDAIEIARIARAAVAALLESRTQAQPAWSRKAIQTELERLGIACSLRSVARYVNEIRRGVSMVVQTSGDSVSESSFNDSHERRR